MSEERTKLISSDLFADLVEQWERRCVALDRLAEDAEKTACDETIARLKTKAGVTRSMTVELKREIRKANSRLSCDPQDRCDEPPHTHND